MAYSSAAASFKLQYAINPIILTGGIASNAPSGIASILEYASGINVVNGALVTAGSNGPTLDDFWAYFQPLPGSTLIDQQIGMYPFANQQVAANATIQQPLVISMLMICPAGEGGGYATKRSQMMSFQSSLNQHNISGGLYTIMTPFFTYIDVVMLTMTDVSRSDTRQVQNAYKLDFIKPLVTLAAAQGAMNGLMSQINGGVATNGAISGSASATPGGGGAVQGAQPVPPVTTYSPSGGVSGGIGMQ